VADDRTELGFKLIDLGDYIGDPNSDTLYEMCRKINDNTEFLTQQIIALNQQINSLREAIFSLQSNT
jgi:DNA-binding transcriptional MerR regulator